MNAAFKTSISKGKCTYPPTSPDSWSPNVFVEGQNVVRVGDTWVKHCKDDCHKPTQIQGSPNVFANRMPIARINDAMDCGDEIATGAGTVFLNTSK